MPRRTGNRGPAKADLCNNTLELLGSRSAIPMARWSAQNVAPSRFHSNPSTWMLSCVEQPRSQD